MSETDVDRVNAVLSTVGTGMVIDEARRFFRDYCTLFQWLPCTAETMQETSQGVKKLTMDKRKWRTYGNLCRLLKPQSWLEALPFPVTSHQLTVTQAGKLTKAFDEQLVGTQAIMRALIQLSCSSITLSHMPPVDVSAMIMADILSDAVELCESPLDGVALDAIQLAVSNALKDAAAKLSLFQQPSRPTGGLSATFDTAFNEWHGVWRASRAISLADLSRRTQGLHRIRAQKLAGEEVGPEQMNSLASNGSPFRSFDTSQAFVTAFSLRQAVIATAFGMETADLINISHTETSTARAHLKEAVLWCAEAGGDLLTNAIAASQTRKDGEMFVTVGGFDHIPNWSDSLKDEHGLHGHCTTSSDSGNLQCRSDVLDGELRRLGRGLSLCKRELLERDSVEGDLYKNLVEGATNMMDAADLLKKSAAFLAWLADNLLETFRFTVVAYSRTYDLAQHNLLNLPLSDKSNPIDRLMHQARVRAFAADNVVLPSLQSPTAVPTYSSPAVRPGFISLKMDTLSTQAAPSGSTSVAAAGSLLAGINLNSDINTDQPPPSSPSKELSESDEGGATSDASDVVPSPAKSMSESEPEMDKEPPARAEASSAPPRRSVRARKPPPKLLE